MPRLLYATPPADPSSSEQPLRKPSRHPLSSGPSLAARTDRQDGRQDRRATFCNIHQTPLLLLQEVSELCRAVESCSLLIAPRAPARDDCLWVMRRGES
jgi:hypothetical protein